MRQIKNDLNKELENAPAISSASKANPLEAMLSKESVKRRFSEVLKGKAPSFMSSILTAYNTNPALQQCDAGSILSSAMISATLDLPINQNLGFAYIIPYKDKATFQMGWKGFVQLAMRSGQYKTLNVSPVYDGEIKYINKFTGEIEFNPDGKKSEIVVGYVAYEKLINGFEKYIYISKEDMQKHALKYSQTYRKGFGVWKDDFDAMAMKTAIKQLLSKWGVLSIEMQKAMEFDQAIVEKDSEENPIPVYIDNGETIYTNQVMPETSESEKKEAKSDSKKENNVKETLL